MSNKKKKRKNNNHTPASSKPKDVNASAKIQQSQEVDADDKALTAEDVEQEMILTVAYEYIGSDETVEAENNDTDIASETGAQNPSESKAADDIPVISDESDETEATEPENSAGDNGSKVKSIKHFTFPKKQKSDKAVVEKETDESSPVYLIRMIAVLTVICMSIALLLAIVNKATVNVIAENAERKKSEAVLTVFPEGDETKSFINSDGEELYIILKSGKILGYAVNVSGSGYVGDIEMMVGVDTEHKLHGLKILSMSETPGVGSKAGADSFLGRFIGIGEAVEIGTNFDGISGATFSSKGVAEGVNKALAYDIDFDTIAEELGLMSDDMNTDANSNVDIDVGNVGEIEEEPIPETEPVIEPAPEPEPVAEPIIEQESTPAAEPVTEQEPAPVAEPVNEQEPAPAAEPVTEQESAPAAEPVAEQESTPAAEPVTEQEPAPVAEPVIEQEPAPDAEPVAEQESAAVTEPGPEPEPVPVTESATPTVIDSTAEQESAPVEESATETEPTSDEEPAAEEEPAPAAEPTTEQEPVPATESTTEQESEPVEEPASEQEPSAGIILDSETEPEEEPEPTAEPEPEPEP